MKMNNELISILKKYQQEIHPVISFNPEIEKLCLFDLSEKNKKISENILENTEEFIRYINTKLQHAGAKLGIGGYAELRAIYSRSKVFNAEQDDEPRRLHLGIDIWGKPNTHVMAPLDGIVHSYAFNNHFGDYGVTIILTHFLDDITFYTLYGHLSLNDIKNLREGERIQKGDVFAEFGLPMENGHWPPHLHFQIISDLENYKGDYPGVCKYSEREKYLNNCPDPDLVLQMNQFL